MGRVSLSFLRGTMGEEEASADQGAGGRRSLSAGDKSPINSLPSPPPLPPSTYLHILPFSPPTDSHRDEDERERVR